MKAGITMSKKIVIWITVLTSVLCTACSKIQNEPLYNRLGGDILDSIGDWTGGERYTFYLFQDGAVHREFYYEAPSFKDNPYFQPVTQEDMKTALRFLDDFEGGWIRPLENATREDGRAFYKNYAYDRASLDKDDYYYIETRNSGNPLENYDLYIFDTQKNTLYFFHSAS